MGGFERLTWCDEFKWEGLTEPFMPFMSWAGEMPPKPDDEPTKQGEMVRRRDGEGYLNLL